jgi:uridine kinase
LRSSFFFDDYASQKDFPNDLNSWLRDGGDPNDIATPLFHNHLIKLINGQPIELVKRNGWAEEYGLSHTEGEVQIIMPSPLIIVEEPFGRKRQELKHLIDFVIYLDIEPEIALGRRIHDLIQYLRNDSEVIINLLDHFLFDYLYQGVKDMYIEIGKKVKVNSNLIINANRNIDDIVLEISELIRRKKGL